MIRIERVTVADAPELVSIYGPYVTDTAISFEYVIPTVEEFAERIKDISSRLPYIKAVEYDEDEESGRILGYAYAAPFKWRKAYDWSVETTIYLRADYKGKGLGRRLYEVLEESLRGMGILNMNACIAVPSGDDDPYLTDGSQRFHERMGFRLVGTFTNSGYKLNRWYDMIWMEKMLGEHCAEQPEPRFGEWDI